MACPFWVTDFLVWGEMEIDVYLKLMHPVGALPSTSAGARWCVAWLPRSARLACFCGSLSTVHSWSGAAFGPTART